MRLDAACTVHVASNGANAVPMLWERNYGKGRFVVNNHGMCEKVTRGLTAAAYSLLQDVFAYPVINSSVFFLDDFPSPVPMATGNTSASISAGTFPAFIPTSGGRIC